MRSLSGPHQMPERGAASLPAACELREAVRAEALMRMMRRFTVHWKAHEARYEARIRATPRKRVV